MTKTSNNKLEILVRTWDTKTLLAGIERQEQAIADLKHEWMGTSAQLASLCKLDKRANVYREELKTRR